MHDEAHLLLLAAAHLREEDTIGGILSSDLDVHTVDHQVAARRDTSIGLVQQRVIDTVDRDARVFTSTSLNALRIAWYYEKLHIIPTAS